MLDEKEILKVRKMVARFLPKSADRDFIADGILIEAWENGQDHVSLIHVRHRCINAHWKSVRELRKNERSVMLYENPQISNLEREEEETRTKLIINRITKVLNPAERRAIWFYFWSDDSLEDVARKMNLRREAVQELLKVALYKLRQEIPTLTENIYG